MDGVKVPYECEVDLMEYVGPLYKYGDWMILTKMWRACKHMDFQQIVIEEKKVIENKGASICIDGRPLALWNVVGLINSSHPNTTNKNHNCMFEECGKIWIMVCAMKIISA